MPRKKRKSDLASLRQQRAANAKHSAIVNPRLIVKVAAIVRDIYTQRIKPDATHPLPHDPRAFTFKTTDAPRQWCPRPYVQGIERQPASA